VLLAALGTALPAFGAGPAPKVSVEIGVNKNVEFAKLAAVLSAIQKGERVRADLTLRIQDDEGISARVQVPPEFLHRDLVDLLDVLKKAGARTIKLQVGTEDQLATPRADTAAIEEKVAQLERDLAAVREEVDNLRRQSQPARAADPGATETAVAWGKPVKDIQAGLRCPTPRLALGEVLSLEVVVRNTGAQSVKVPHVQPSAFLAAVEGQQLILRPVGIGDGFGVTRDLAPGEEMAFGVSLLLLPPRPAVSPGRPWVEITPGNYRVSSPSVLLWRDGNDGKLATGSVELEVLPAREEKE
jgi:hypothetical protein